MHAESAPFALKIGASDLVAAWREALWAQIWNFDLNGTSQLPGAQGRLLDLIAGYMVEDVLGRDDQLARSLLEEVVRQEDVAIGNGDRELDPYAPLYLGSWVETMGLSALAWAEGHRGTSPAWDLVLDQM